jgi:hypothetical protein
LRIERRANHLPFDDFKTLVVIASIEILSAEDKRERQSRLYALLRLLPTTGDNCSNSPQKGHLNF